jgi:thiol-disulfide isomerase/thioredoxin
MKNKFLLVSIVVIALSIFIWILNIQDKKTSQSDGAKVNVLNESSTSNTTELDSGSKEVDNEKMSKNELSEDSMAMNISGKYMNYSEAIVAEEQAKGNTVVLFFHAPWCPFCRSADSAFNSRAKEIPERVTVIKTDYDSNPDLKKKYAVTYQHTFVQIDNDRNSISKWTGGDIETLKSNLK